jgi:hypothetical protein
MCNKYILEKHLDHVYYDCETGIQKSVSYLLIYLILHIDDQLGVREGKTKAQEQSPPRSNHEECKHSQFPSNLYFIL